MRPRDFVAALEDPNLPRCGVGGEPAEQLRLLLVHLFFIDHDLDKRELSLLERVLPNVDVRDFVKSRATRSLDLQRLARLFPDPQDRNDIVTLAEHAAWGDNKLERREWDLVQRLMDTLGVTRE